jgi:hypothetical protein
VSDERQAGDAAPIPVFRISFANATVLAAGYLLVGALVEVARRTANWRWAEKVSWSMEAFPAGILRSFGLLDPVREAFADGRIDQTHVRLIYAGAVVLVVYGIGLGVGFLMWLVTRWQSSRGA